MSAPVVKFSRREVFAEVRRSLESAPFSIVSRYTGRGLHSCNLKIIL